MKLHNFSEPVNQPYPCKWSQEDSREFVGQLNIKVVKGSQLAVRDMLTSDPYVVLTLGEKVELRFIFYIYCYTDLLLKTFNN